MARPSPEITNYPAIPWTRVLWNGTTTSGFFTNIGTTYGSYISYRSYTSSVTPGWHSLSRRGKVRIRPLDHTFTLQRDSGTPFVEVNHLWFPNGSYAGVDTYTIGNSVVVMGHPTSSHLGEAYTKARARLAAKVNDMSVNVAQCFGERRQTASLFISTASRIANAAVALKRGHLGEFIHNLSLGQQGVSAKQWERVVKTPPDLRVARHWLEFQYGWKPLLQDVFGAAELLAQHSQERYVTASSSSATAKQLTVTSTKTPSPYESLQLTVTKCKMKSSYVLDSASRAGLAQTGISNPALLAWELLPYSFVVDWFLPVGNYLQALDAFCGFQFLEGWMSNMTKVTRQENWLGLGPKQFVSGQYQQYGRFGSATTSWVSYNRTRLDTWPGVGKLSFKNPIGGDPLTRFATAASLLRVAFHK